MRKLKNFLTIRKIGQNFMKEKIGASCHDKDRFNSKIIIFFIKLL